MSEQLNVLLEFYRDNDRMVETVERVNDSYLEMLDALEVLEAENAKLRQQLTDVAESMGRVEERNAKLRELVADMWYWHYEGHIDSESQERQMLHIDAVIQRMRELGVEL